MAQESEISRFLAPYQAFITYAPLRTEVDWREHLTLPTSDMIYHIAPRASLDPAKEALDAMRRTGAARTAILIPGRRFDAAGTRYGQGGGWYDRFLKRVPRSWLRVGFCFAPQFSPQILPRQSWDQPMDAVLVVDPVSKSGTLYPCTASAS